MNFRKHLKIDALCFAIGSLTNVTKIANTLRFIRKVNEIAKSYSEKLKNVVQVPIVPDGFYSSWAQYTIKLNNKAECEKLQEILKDNNIPSMIYYSKPMHLQGAFKNAKVAVVDLSIATDLSDNVLSLPMHPYMTEENINKVCNVIINNINT